MKGPQTRLSDHSEFRPPKNRNGGITLLKVFGIMILTVAFSSGIFYATVKIKMCHADEEHDKYDAFHLKVSEAMTVQREMIVKFDAQKESYDKSEILNTNRHTETMNMLRSIKRERPN